MFLISQINRGSHPAKFYTNRDRVIRKFSEDTKKHKNNIEQSNDFKIKTILPDTLFLCDKIGYEFYDVYNSLNSSRAGRLKIVEKVKKDGATFDFPFSGLPNCEYRLTKGGLYPLFAAFRNKVQINPDTGQAEWEGGFDSVIDLWNKIGQELVQQTKEAIKEIGHTPDVLGKSQGHWNSLHMKVKIRLLEAEKEQYAVWKIHGVRQYFSDAVCQKSTLRIHIEGGHIEDGKGEDAFPTHPFSAVDCPSFRAVLPPAFRPCINGQCAISAPAPRVVPRPTEVKAPAALLRARLARGAGDICAASSRNAP